MRIISSHHSPWCASSISSGPFALHQPLPINPFICVCVFLSQCIVGLHVVYVGMLTLTCDLPLHIICFINLCVSKYKATQNGGVTLSVKWVRLSILNKIIESKVSHCHVNAANRVFYLSFHTLGETSIPLYGSSVTTEPLILLVGPTSVFVSYVSH